MDGHKSSSTSSKLVALVISKVLISLPDFLQNGHPVKAHKEHSLFPTPLAVLWQGQQKVALWKLHPQPRHYEQTRI